MMREYYSLHDYIMGKAICTKAGIQVEDLRLDDVCLNFILGMCNKEGCTRTRRHPRVAEATERQVTQLCNRLKRGVDEMTREKRQRLEQMD